MSKNNEKASLLKYAILIDLETGDIESIPSEDSKIIVQRTKMSKKRPSQRFLFCCCLAFLSLVTLLLFVLGITCIITSWYLFESNDGVDLVKGAFSADNYLTFNPNRPKVTPKPPYTHRLPYPPAKKKKKN